MAAAAQRNADTRVRAAAKAQAACAKATASMVESDRVQQEQTAKVEKAQTTAIARAQAAYESAVASREELADRLAKAESPGRARMESPLSPRKEREMRAYCPKCQDRRELCDGKPVTFANGRPAVQGRSGECGARMARIVRIEKPDGAA